MKYKITINIPVAKIILKYNLNTIYFKIVQF